MTSLRWVEIDFETASACNLKISGAWRYAEDPTTEIVCLSYSLMGAEPVLLGPEQLIYDPLPPFSGLVHDESVTFVAHNAAFEKAIWRKIMVPVFGWPDIPNHRWHDSLAVCGMKCIPQSLEDAAVVLRLPHQKDTEGSRVMRGFSKPNKKGYIERNPALLQRAYDYNLQDIRTQVALHERIGWLPPGERRVWLLDQKINERGIKVDLDFVAAARNVVDRASIPLLAEFSDLTGGLKPTQRDKFMAWIEARGVDMPDLKKETLVAILGSDDENEEADPGAYIPRLTEEVHRALSIRQLIGSASIKKLKRMELVVCDDGRARGLLQYHGAGPGRWAGRLFQPQNFPRGTLKDASGKAPDPKIVVDAIMTGDPAHVETVLGPPIEAVVSSLRHSLVPEAGKIFVAGDFAGIEARIVLALAGQHDKTALMESGVDIYCDMASKIFERPIDKDKDLVERQAGKNAVLGLGFQMGMAKFRARYAAGQSEDFCQRVVDTYRKIWAPKVPELWYGLEGAAVRTVHDRTPHEEYGVRYELEDGWLTARLPSGRKLWYFNPQPCKRAMPWDETDVRLAWTYQAQKMGQWRTIDAFGGLLTENVVQGLARDLMVAAMFKAEEAGLPVVLTVHDEIVCEPEGRYADPKKLAQIMSDSPDWARFMKVPVSAATWVGERYKK